MRKIRMGVIGCGSRIAQEYHFPALKQVEGVVWKYACDTQLELARKIAKQYGFEKATDNYREVLADQDVDMVVILTRVDMHAQLAIEAAKAGKHIDSLPVDDLYWNARIYGSYYVEELVQGDHVTLKANPYYKTNNPNIKNQGKPHVDRVVVRFMKDNFAIVQGLIAGQIDIASSYLTVDNLPELQAVDQLVVTAEKNAGIYSFIINPDFELFADENVRRALTLLIDRDMIYEQSNGTLFPAYNLVSDFAIGYSEEFTNWFQENYTSMKGREEAIALLAEAGWTDTDGDGLLDKDGQVFEFTLSEFNHDSMFLNLLQIQLMDVGILMNIDPLTNSTEFRRLLGKEGWEVGLASNSFAEISSILVGHLEQVKMAGLFSDEEYAKLDELFVKAQSCLDNGKAEGYYNEVLREIVGTGCYIPISTPAVIIVYDKDVYDGVYYRRDATKIWLNDCE